MPIFLRSGSVGATALILFAAVFAVELQAQTPQKRWTKYQIIRMLKGDIPPKRVETLARERGIDFEITPVVENELRRAGASDALLATLRELAPKPSNDGQGGIGSSVPILQPTQVPQIPAQITVETSPAARIYLDDTFQGQAGPDGRFVFPYFVPGQHRLRVSLAGKKDYEKLVTIVTGDLMGGLSALANTNHVQATLADVEEPKPVGGTIRQNPKDGLKYVWIPPGTFQMGCSPGDSECYDWEKPSHQVRISKGFWLGQTPVTVGAYKRFARSAGKGMPPEPNILGRALNSGWSNDAMPIVDVTWDEARDYCTSAGGRLPTEAEWEFAARSGSTEARYGPLDEVAWYADNSGQQHLDSAQVFSKHQNEYIQRLKDNGNGMHEVGQKRANGFGLYDMLGNVWQWVNDWYDANYYQNSPSQDPTGPPSGTLRVFRGGSWDYNPRYIRVSFRSRIVPGYRNFYNGFRCVGEVAAQLPVLPVSEESRQVVYSAGGDVSLPREFYAPSPDYSEEARKAKLNGDVVLSLVIDAQGNPTDIRVVKSLGMGLDEKAVEKVMTWKFLPGKRNGVPVPVRVQLEVTFRLF